MTAQPGFRPVDAVRLPERPARPQARVNLLGALAVTAVAAFALVVALTPEQAADKRIERRTVRPRAGEGA